MSSRMRQVLPRAVRRSNRTHQRIPRAWHLFNADGKVVGRVAAAAAHLLQGKHKPVFNRSKDCGDYVVIVNAEFVNFTGKKWKKKIYRHHTGYPGGLKEIAAKVCALFRGENRGSLGLVFCWEILGLMAEDKGEIGGVKRGVERAQFSVTLGSQGQWFGFGEVCMWICPSDGRFRSCEIESLRGFSKGRLR
eukprot:289809-Amorphochlora_amoeboformis.AAC.1